MNFNKHSHLKGKHAFLSPSKYHWINYTEDKLKETYLRSLAVERGTRLHEHAAESIDLGLRLAKNNKTINQYINDAIGFKMSPEVVLYYSDDCFGTADALSFRNNMLRIHDLKTGTIPAHMEQLMTYAALFCLEYKIKPSEIEIELRIYQNDQIECYRPTVEDILPICDKIISSDKIINKIKEMCI